MKELFWQLMPYLNKKYYPGRGLRWIINDGKNRNVDCFCCGNYANGVARVNLCGSDFNLPICKKHAGSYMDKHSNGQPWELCFPTVININVTYKISNHDSI
jgi:hypothetical protein